MRSTVWTIATLLVTVQAAALGAAEKPMKTKTPYPPVQPAKEVHFPTFEQKVLANGLRVVVIEHSEIAGPSSTVRNDSINDALIGASRLEGGPAVGAICAGVYDEAFTFFAGPACP